MSFAFFMLQILRIVSLGLCSLLIILFSLRTLQDLGSLEEVRRVKRELSSLSPTKKFLRVSSVAEKVETDNIFSPYRLSSLQAEYADLVYAISLYPKQLESRISLLCRSADLYRAGILTSPLHLYLRAKKLSAQSKLYHQMSREGFPSCLTKGDIQSSGDMKSHLKKLVSITPFNPSVRYHAANTFFELGFRKEAFDSYKVLLDSYQYNTKSFREFLFTLPKTRDELKRILPSQYPEVLLWINHFSYYRQSFFNKHKSLFLSFGDKAVSEALSQAASPYFSSSKLRAIIERVVKSREISQYEPVRKRLDKNLASILEKEEGSFIHSLYRKRSDYQCETLFSKRSQKKNTIALSTNRDFLEFLNEPKPFIVSLFSLSPVPHNIKDYIEIHGVGDGGPLRDLSGDMKIYSFSYAGRHYLHFALGGLVNVKKIQIRYANNIYSDSLQLDLARSLYCSSSSS